MFKKEWIYRELACAHLRERGVKQTGLALSRKFDISLSTVHHAMLPLKQNGIAVTGNGESVTVTKKGMTFGFLGYNDIGGKEPGLAWADPEKITSDIKTLRPSVDIVIEFFTRDIVSCLVMFTKVTKLPLSDTV